MRKGSVWQLDGLPSVPTQNMAEDKWLALRREGIGGSDIAGIMGSSPWRTPLGVYVEKKNLVPDKETNEAMLFGVKMEPVLREWAAEAIAEKVSGPIAVFSSPYMYHLEGAPHFLANVDGVVVENEAVIAGLELKTVDRSKAREWEGGVPLYYAQQVQWYMGVTGLPRWFVFALIGKKQSLHLVERDDTVIAELQMAADAFWKSNVVQGVMPRPVAEDTDNLLKLFPDATEEIIRDDSLEIEIKQYLALGEEAKQIEDSRDTIKASLMATLGTSLALLAGDYKVSWSRFDVDRIDAKLLREKYPEAAAACTKTNRQGRLMVKEAK